jgi:uncharacterized protein YraI
MPSFRKFIVAGAILVGIGLVPAVASAQEQPVIIAYIGVDLNLREGPSTDYRIITSMQQGSEVRILYCNTSMTWCYLQYRQHVGWASSRYLSASAPQYAQAPQQQYPQYPQQQYPQYPQQQYPQYPQQAYQQPPPPPPPQQYVVVPPQQPNVVVVQPSPYPYYWAGFNARFGLWLNFLFR